MTTVKQITNYLEEIAPLSYQESYDNCGLLTGNHDDIVTGILVSLDCTEDIVEEAIKKKCNMIVAHHPIIFKGLKSLTGKNYVERTIIKAIQNNISIYAIHTNLDSISNGVNKKFADLLGLKNTSILAPTSNKLKKLVTYVPLDHEDNVKKALWDMGVGKIGNYDSCSFSGKGIGTFRPLEKSNPFSGTKGEIESTNEACLHFLFPSHLESQVINRLKESHPYEEVAYYIIPVDNVNQDVGFGMIGHLPESMSSTDFLGYLKSKMSLDTIKHTAIGPNKINNIAICGGSGFGLLRFALQKKADAYVTADIKYHEFFDSENRLLLCDIGHYESEVETKNLISDIIKKTFTSFATYISKQNTNPIQYYH